MGRSTGTVASVAPVKAVLSESLALAPHPPSSLQLDTPVELEESKKCTSQTTEDSDTSSTSLGFASVEAAPAESEDSSDEDRPHDDGTHLEGSKRRRRRRRRRRHHAVASAKAIQVSTPCNADTNRSVVTWSDLGSGLLLGPTHSHSEVGCKISRPPGDSSLPATWARPARQTAGGVFRVWAGQCEMLSNGGLAHPMPGQNSPQHHEAEWAFSH